MTRHFEVLDPHVPPSQMATLDCTRCAREFPAGADALACPYCGEGFVLVGDDRLGAVHPVARPAGIWDFASSLPAVPPSCRVTLGEGGTPLSRLTVRGVSGDVWVKNEGVSPTQSYKDRFNAVNVSVALAMECRGVALISTGNAGLSAAAYGAAAGLEVRVICPPTTPKPIVRGIEAFGAELVVLPPGQSLEALTAALAEGFFPGSRSVPPTGVTPFGAEGYKTIAYEIAAELGGAPDVVLAPVGSGDGIYGIHRGFAELRRAGLTPSVPRMIGARTAAACAPSIAYDEVGPHAVAVVERSGGSFVAVTGEQIRAALETLSHAGISAEPASAATVAALAPEVVAPGEQAVCVVTGGGFKWAEVLDAPDGPSREGAEG